MHGRTFKLKADTKASKWDSKTRESTEYIMPAGSMVKVVMVSRFGDCGITLDLKAENGYDARVQPEALEII